MHLNVNGQDSRFRKHKTLLAFNDLIESVKITYDSQSGVHSDDVDFLLCFSNLKQIEIDEVRIANR